MAEERTQRRLAAILAADVVGYSRLVGVDEPGTLRAFKEHLNELIEPSLGHHRGRIVKTMGDGILAEFASAVDAVVCARAIQDGMIERNADVADDRRLQFRMGVNVGDIVIDGDDIHGEGVNIAARLEGLAEPGGICISNSVYEQVHGKLDLEFTDLGDQEVKNIARPVRVFRVNMGEAKTTSATTPVKPTARPKKTIFASIAAVVALAIGLLIWEPWVKRVEPASVAKMAFKLPDKPSIAVLPFEDFSEKKDKGYFADGLTEEIVSNLARFETLFVIARNSTKKYKDKAVDVRNVAQDLGVRYVLEGSLRSSGDTLRVTAQLIDALRGVHVWAQTYDRRLKDILVLQDEITREIVGRLASEVTVAEFKRRSREQTARPEAYALFQQGADALQRSNPQSNAQAIRLFQQAIAKDPNYGRAYAFLAWARRHNAVRGWHESAEDTMERALALAERAVVLAPDDPLTHLYLGSVHRQMRNYEKALVAAEKAAALSPGDAGVLMSYASTLARAGRHDEGARLMDKVLRLDPHGPFILHNVAGIVYFQAVRYEDSAASFERARRINPRARSVALALHAAAYAHLDQLEKAHAARDAYLQINPKYTLKLHRRVMRSWKSSEARKRAMDGLRKAGFPESPPLNLPDKPSIAVLPFTNMSADKEQDYFADGITEDIITDLSKVSGLFIIARNSTTRYKGKTVDVRQIANDLGVRYVVEGSVRRSSDRVRITAQLIDATTGNHVWAERYDRKLANVFAIQDDVSAKIVATVAVTLTADERQHARRKHLPRPEVHDMFLRGAYGYSPPTPKNLASARRLLEQVIALDPDYAQAYSRLSSVLALSVFSGASNSRAEDMETARRMAQKAITLGDRSARPYNTLARLHLVRGQFDEAVRVMESAMRIASGSAGAQWAYGYYLAMAGRAEEGIVPTEVALRLAPFSPVTHSFAGATYYYAGQYAKAVEHFKRRETLGGRRANAPREALRAAAEMFVGNEEAARITVQKLLQKRPGYTVTAALRSNRSKNSKDNDRLADALRRAGLPE